MDYPGIDGFLGTRASIMLDVVFMAMFAIVPVLGWSIWLVKYRRNYLLHKRVQVALLIVLGVAVGLFEIDVRFISGWRERAEPSPYYASVESAGPVWDAIFVKMLGRPATPGWVFRAWLSLLGISQPESYPVGQNRSVGHVADGGHRLDFLLVGVRGVAAGE
jgi:hypothetical protein